MAKKASSRKSATGRGVSGAKTSSKQAAKKSVRKAAKAERRPSAEAKASDGGNSKPADPLSKKELKEFRQMLLAKRRELVGDMTGIEAEALGADRQESKGDISDHPADAATDNFEQEFSLELLESERTLLAEIDGAIRRIEEGIYGICLGTGKPIGRTRLKARPWASYGIEYARMVEKGLVRPGERITPESGDEDDDVD
ncbi:MAG TPA: TraR/DksA family transcriptional regulator [Phycisphaerae bacterium]|nr:TraR/DksA family transcriptional regulator [Phycisphaerae bacterium]